MFTGIIESIQPILKQENFAQVVRLQIQRPTEFDDIRLGDSIACNGICLTIEKFDATSMTFALAAETLKILRWSENPWSGKKINLERSMRLGDRVHGHLVSGHVDDLARVVRTQNLGDSYLLDVEVTEKLLPYIWNKGSITLHGVSLTVNEIRGSQVSVCLIPETIVRTNLTQFAVGEFLNVEADYFAKAVINGAAMKGLIRGV